MYYLYVGITVVLVVDPDKVVAEEGREIVGVEENNLLD